MAVRGSNYIRPVAEGHGQGAVLDKLEARATAENKKLMRVSADFVTCTN